MSAFDWALKIGTFSTHAFFVPFFKALRENRKTHSTVKYSVVIFIWQRASEWPNETAEGILITLEQPKINKQFEHRTTKLLTYFGSQN